MNGLAWYESIQSTTIEQQAFNLKLDVALSVEKEMTRQGMSRTHMAQKMGTSAPYITKILQGDANLTIDSLVKLAAVLGKDVEIRFRTPGQASQWFDVINGAISRASANNYFGHASLQPSEASHGAVA